GGTFFAGDVLDFVNDGSTMGNISGVYDGAGKLTLTSTGASATTTEWQAALDAVTYSSTSRNPTDFGTDTTGPVTWTANDGILDSTPVTSTVNIAAVDDAPSATAPSTHYSATEQTDLSLKNTGLSVSDVDGGGLAQTETATLSVGEGILTVTAGGSGAIVANSGTSSVQITGTIAQIDALLNTDGTSTVIYNDNIDNPGPNTTLTLHIDDGGHTGTGGPLTADATATIDVTAVEDPPGGGNLGPAPLPRDRRPPGGEPRAHSTRSPNP